MRKRTWLWCALAALALSLNVACDENDIKDIIDEIIPTPTVTDSIPTPPATDSIPATQDPTQPDPTIPTLPTIPNPDPTIQVPESTVWEDVIEMLNTEATIDYEGGEVTFVTRTNQTWWIEVDEGATWMEVTDAGRAIADYTIKVAVQKNNSVSERRATITLCYDDAADSRIELTVIQTGRPATATIPLYVELPNTSNYYNVAGNYDVSELITGSDQSMTPQLGYIDDNGEYVWQDWDYAPDGTFYDGWYGMEGPATWGSGNAVVCFKPSANGSFSFISCYPGTATGTELTFWINYGNNVIVEVHAVVTDQ